MAETEIRRREFLAGSLVAAASAAGVGFLASNTTTAQHKRQLAWNSETFRDLNGASFRFRTGGHTTTRLRFVRVEDGRFTSRTHVRNAERKPFTLTFEAAGAAALSQGTYSVWHPRLGDFPLFIVPLESRQGHYECIFA